MATISRRNFLKGAAASAFSLAAAGMMNHSAFAEAPAEETAKVDIEASGAVFATTTNGVAMGYRYNGIDTYFAIKYATAERFKAPEAFTWDGVRCCNVMGEIAPQSSHATASRDLFNGMPYNLLQVENEAECLELNVWTPETAAGGNRPVIVWLHGGGYTTGSSTQFTFYLGEQFARDNDVVFVSVNHRLNCLGYLDVSAYGGDEYKYSGNAGMLDIELALQWVQDNIASFGGDAGNVTIIGQSGGGGKVTTLMGMPSAQGLFHKAVALSGGSAQITRDTATAQADAALVVEQLGLTGASNEEIMEKLTTMRYEELYEACSTAKISYGPVMDGDLIPTGNYEISKDIPFIASNVLGEFSTNYAVMAAYTPSADVYNMLANLTDADEDQILGMYNSTYGEDYGQQILDAFKEAYPTHPIKDGLYINNRYGGFSALPLCQAMNDYGGTSYNSMVAYDYPIYGGIVPVHTASSIPFWFDNVQCIPQWTAGDQANAQAVNDAMSGALAAFAKTGNPSTDEHPWEAYTADNGATMVFDAQSEVKYFHDKALLELVTEAQAALAAAKG